MCKCLVVWFLASWCTWSLLGASSSTGAELFPFQVSYGDREVVTDVSGWLDKPAGKHGFVRVENGRLVTNAGPIRFWGTNLCFEACFPTKEDAERLARRVASFGFNCVRLHHMDSYSIWGDSPNKTIIDLKKLDRLDYLIYQLKQHGIYVNINLHVSRWLDEKEGFPHRNQRPNYDKGLGNFEPRMIELQKKYARDLLTHLNPYTRTRYTDEPAVAFVEISNEDALFTVWNWGDMDDLPEPYATTYRQLWNRWLLDKYGTTNALRRAWGVGEIPLGEELLPGGEFGPDFEKYWRIERDAETLVQCTPQSGGPQGTAFLRIVVEKKGTVPWRPQISHPGVAVRKNHAYTLSCYLRADRTRSLSLNCMMAHEPWERLGFSTTVQLSPEWKEYRFVFLPDRDDANARITITSLEPGVYELAKFSLRPGGVYGLKSGQTLEDSSVPVLRRGELGVTEMARHDFSDFLWDTEYRYWVGMYEFLKKDLGVKSLVSGTQLSYSPVHIQAKLDYIDAHSYWQHPAFPGRPWDPENWYVRDVAMVNSPGGHADKLGGEANPGDGVHRKRVQSPDPQFLCGGGFSHDCRLCGVSGLGWRFRIRLFP